LGIEKTEYYHTHRQSEENEKLKVKTFLTFWKDFDWTVELDGGQY
jgi:hypothetical protein